MRGKETCENKLGEGCTFYLVGLVAGGQCGEDEQNSLLLPPVSQYIIHHGENLGLF